MHLLVLEDRPERVTALEQRRGRVAYIGVCYGAQDVDVDACAELPHEGSLGPRLALVLLRILNARRVDAAIEKLLVLGVCRLRAEGLDQ